MPKWISINMAQMEQSAVSSNEAIKWANQTKCQTATIIAFLSHVICLRAYILFAMIDKIKMRWTLTIRQYTTYVMGNDWCPLTAGDGDLVIAPFPPFCLLLAIRLLVALTMIAMALLGALMIHKHPAPLLEIALLSPTWYWEDFDWLCIRCILCLLVLLLSSLLSVYQTILICQDFSADTELQLAWPGAEVSE